MENLINAIETQQATRLSDFNATISEVQNIQHLDKWQFSDLLPKGKNLNNFKNLEDAKAYLLKRKEKQIKKEIENKLNFIKSISNAGELIDIKITVEWKKSKMWGSNPVAQCWYGYTNNEGNFCRGHVTSGSIVGCGYDKQSEAVARCLNQINCVLKPLYVAKDKAIDKSNHEILGYGSGYGICPSIEGGVGVNCYPSIFNKIGYNFQTIASGKTFDVYTITKTK